MRAGTPRGYAFHTGRTILDDKDTKSKYVSHPNMVHRDIYDYVYQAAGGRRLRPHFIVYQLGHGGESSEYLTLVRYFAWQNNQSNCCRCRDFSGDDPCFLMMTYIG
jgi:hypothetical protein